MALCATCYAPAAVLYVARGVGGYRAVLACEWDRSKARKWAAGAGPVRETPITPDPRLDPHSPTLF